jgi:phosphinothricin acetyltransferase
MTVRQALPSDADALSRIYNHYVRETIVTFEEEPVSPKEMTGRLEAVLLSGLPWLIGEYEDKICGFAHASSWKSRYAYRFAVETTVYLDPKQVGRGYGTRLYEAILAMLRDRGIHAAIGGIALPNEASVALHEKLGFKKVAQFREVGYKFNRWIDVGYWELLL